MTEKIVFYNKNYLIKTEKGYKITSLEKLNIPCGIKIKVPVETEIYIDLDIITSNNTVLAGFINDKSTKLLETTSNSSLIKKIKINTQNYDFLGLIYYPKNKNDGIILRKFTYSIVKDFCHRDFFDQVYFINLNHRVIRRKHIIQQLKKLNFDFSKVFHINAFYLPNQPQIGCALSHMKALQHAYIHKYKKILILEDDFTFVVNENLFNFKLKTLENNFPNWDIVQFSTINQKSSKTRVNNINKVIKADTTAGYMIKYDKILPIFNIFKTCVNPNPLYKGNKFAIDVAWQPIQSKLNWYLFQPNIGKQSEKFTSDIEKFRSYSWIC